MISVSLIAIPGWIDQWLAISKKPLSILVNLEELSKVLTKDDYCYYLYCQSLSNRVMDKSLIQSFNKFDFGMYEADVYESIERFSLQNPSDSILPLVNGSMEQSTEEGKSYQDYSYKLVEVTSNVLGYRLISKDSQNTQTEEQLIALSDTLERLSVYEGFCNAASTPAMKSYIRLTAGI